MSRRRGFLIAVGSGCAGLVLYGLTGRAASGPEVHLLTDSIEVQSEAVVGTLSDQSAAVLTLDPVLQQSADKLLSLARPLNGAALLLDVRSGQLRAYSEYKRPGLPAGKHLMTEGAPAASVFKIATATALLEKTPVGPKTRVCSQGGERGIAREHLEPPPPEHALCGRFAAALGFSRNAVFAQLATKHLLRDDLLEISELLGFNQALPFDVPASVGSLELPFNDLEFARAAAGFSGSRLTPLGAAHITYAITLGGMAGRMRLIKRHGDWEAPRERELTTRIMKANTAWRLTRMMEVTVHSGTSLDAFTAPSGRSYLGAIRVAGKTGTLSQGENSTYSWFTGFAPSRNPKVVVTVLLENSTTWRKKANEVARDLLRLYFAGARGVTDPFTPDE